MAYEAQLQKVACKQLFPQGYRSFCDEKLAKALRRSWIETLCNILFVLSLCLTLSFLRNLSLQMQDGIALQSFDEKSLCFFVELQMFAILLPSFYIKIQCMNLTWKWRWFIFLLLACDGMLSLLARGLPAFIWQISIFWYMLLLLIVLGSKFVLMKLENGIL